ncbi:hypothetical protein E2C01_021606 [Portunus trituberculatus]|uniref:Uncharacterized protein n=1 Tax=Portunus trituberculatus TaxID=210409 RepID=A0A5B7E302_PORTR|nr:hypothetical protein [Portunus trituberculatus]
MLDDGDISIEFGTRSCPIQFLKPFWYSTGVMVLLQCKEPSHTFLSVPSYFMDSSESVDASIQ